MFSVSRKGYLLQIVLLSMLVMGGCAGMGKYTEKPKISVADIQVQEMKTLETAFIVQLRVMNPNDISLDIEGIDCSLEIDGKHFAQGLTGEGYKVPAYGTALVPITVYASMFDMVSSVVGLVQANNRSGGNIKPLGYRLTGNIRVGNSGLSKRIPFESAGELTLDGLNRSQ